MSVFASQVNSLVRFIGGALGSFETTFKNGKDGTIAESNGLRPLGHLFDAIVKSCTFEPANTPAQLAAQMEQIGRQNKLLEQTKEQFDHLPDLPKTRDESWGEEKKELYDRCSEWNAAIEELNRHQKNFQPLGGLIVGGSIATIMLTMSHWAFDTFLPRAFRDHAKLVTKTGVLGSYGALTLGATQGWQRHSTFGGFRFKDVACSDDRI